MVELEVPDELKVVTGHNFLSLQLRKPIEIDVERDGNDPYQRRFEVKLDRDFDALAVSSFFGHDRGDAYEMSIEAYSDTWINTKHMRDFFWRRIDEGTAPDGAGSRYELLASRISVRVLRLDVLCRVTGKNMLVERGHPSYPAGGKRKWRGVFDFNMILLGDSAVLIEG